MAATEEHVRRRIGPWATVTEVTPDAVVLTIEANDLSWAVFGLGHLDAPVTLLDAPDELRAALAAWSSRLADISTS